MWLKALKSTLEAAGLKITTTSSATEALKLLRDRGFAVAMVGIDSDRFDWQPTQVTYSVDLEDGQGFRTLWTLSGAADTVIPSHPAPCFMNLWHNANHWLNDRPARPPRRPVSFRVDRVSIP